MHTRTGLERLGQLRLLGKGINRVSAREGNEIPDKHAPCVCLGVKQRLLEK